MRFLSKKNIVSFVLFCILCFILFSILIYLIFPSYFDNIDYKKIPLIPLEEPIQKVLSLTEEGVFVVLEFTINGIRSVQSI